MPEGEVIVYQKSKSITRETGTELRGQTIQRQEPQQQQDKDQPREFL
jgi:hypothetical protein